MIRERVNSGLQRARVQGKQLGRPKVSERLEQRIRDLRETGMGIRKVSQGSWRGCQCGSAGHRAGRLA